MSQGPFKTRTRVRYAETDASGIVYYANYFIYFELGRLEMFRALGLPYDRRLPIRDTSCRYHASARFDDLLEVHTSVAEVRSKGFSLASRVYRVTPAEELELLAEGSTVMVTADSQGRPVPVPGPFLAALGGE